MLLHGYLFASDQLHATELGVTGLEKITSQLFELQNKFKFRFDFYYIHKPTYALVILFESIFDAGINPSISWHHYWTPLRFPLILRLASLINEELLKEAWQLNIAKRIEKKTDKIALFLKKLRTRALESKTLDERSREIIVNGVSYGIQNPLELDFGIGGVLNDQNILSPNAVGFQFVVQCIARRCRNRARRDGTVQITVDRQQQFNKKQAETYFLQRQLSESIKEENNFISNHPLYEGISRDDIALKGLPNTKPNFSASTDSIGLQIVDIYLWITKRLINNQKLPPPLHDLANTYLRHSSSDSISMEGMTSRWKKFEQTLNRHKFSRNGK